MLQTFLRCSTQISISVIAFLKWVLQVNSKIANKRGQQSSAIHWQWDHADAVIYINLSNLSMGSSQGTKCRCLEFAIMLTTSPEPSDQLYLCPKASLCYSREALPGCEKGWDMIFGSIGLTGGCSTGISFEVGSTTLLSPPGGRKAFGWRGAHVLHS